MRTATAIWVLAAGVATAQIPPTQTSPAAPGATAASPATATTAADDQRRFPRSSGGVEAAATPPDLSADFDAFAPDNTPPPRTPRFDPRRLSLAPRTDPLAPLIRNGPSGAVLSPTQSPEPWMLPGVRRIPTLGDPPPGSTPATRAASPRAPAG